MLNEDRVYERFERIFNKISDSYKESRSLYGRSYDEKEIAKFKDKAMIFAIVREINQEPLDWEDC